MNCRIRTGSRQSRPQPTTKTAQPGGECRRLDICPLFRGVFCLVVNAWQGTDRISRQGAGPLPPDSGRRRARWGSALRARPVLRTTQFAKEAPVKTATRSVLALSACLLLGWSTSALGAGSDDGLATKTINFKDLD